LFKDDEIAEEILKATKPAQCKALGRKAQGFNEELWNNNRTRIVLEGNYLKVIKHKYIFRINKVFLFSLHKMKI
jgi:predicted NAD-dependent protein-ADP-ribosyltransferase YbiA (DUF1768 family)